MADALRVMGWDNDRLQKKFKAHKIRVEVEIKPDFVASGGWGWWVWTKLEFGGARAILAYRDGFNTFKEAKKHFEDFRKALVKADIQIGRRKPK